MSGPNGEHDSWLGVRDGKTEAYKYLTYRGLKDALYLEDVSGGGVNSFPVIRSRGYNRWTPYPESVTPEPPSDSVANPSFEETLVEIADKIAKSKESLDPKGDAGKLKPQLHLIPTVMMESAAKVFDLGAKKYGAWNFIENKVCATTYISAIMRHLNAWRDGEDLDPESRTSHLGHIIANCGILLDADKHGTLVDDRAKTP